MPKDSLGRSGPKKQLSCESCRKRKIRCERPVEPGSLEAAVQSSPLSKLTAERNLPTCIPCASLRFECVTLYDRKRRGPSGARRSSDLSSVTPTLRAAGELPLIPDQEDADEGQSPYVTNLPSFQLTTPPRVPSPEPNSLSHAPQSPSVSTPRQTLRDRDWSAARLSLPMAHSSSNQVQQWTPPSLPAIPESHPLHGLVDGSHASSSTYQTSHGGQSGWSDPQTAIVPARNPAHRVQGHRQLILEETLPRDTAVYMVSLYFDYVHCLVPCLHRPTFFERLRQRDDARDPLFYAMVMSVIAASLVHIPKTLLPVNDEPPISLAGRCIRASRIVSVDLYDPPSLDMVIIRYFDSVFYSLTGKKGSWVAALSEVRGLALQLQMHRESSYAGLNPLDAEMRRRTFITIFMADKSAACMQDQLIMLRGEDCDTRYFQDLDDEYITSTQCHPQPLGTTAQMAGHRLIAQIFTIVGEIVEIRRTIAKQKSTNNPTAVLTHLRNLDNLDRQLGGIFNDLPGPLRLEAVASPVQFDTQSATSKPWEMQALSNLNAYFSTLIDPTPAPIVHEAFLVMQGNIHVTRAIARLTMISAREETIAFSGPPGSAGRSAAERVLSYSYLSHDRKDTVVSDLLDALKKIPVQNLSVNSHSLVNKVRFVAVTLLDSVLTPDTGAMVEGSSAQMNQEALMSFLGILSEIEQGLVNDQHST